MARAHNFFAGPAVLPLSVIEETRDAVMDFSNMGVSIMEISHRDRSPGRCLEYYGLVG